MSLMNCPECGGEMSEFAKSCPRCGMPNKKTTENKKSKLKTIMSRFKILIVIIISVITLLVIGMILYRFSAKYIMNKFIDAYNNRDIDVINKLMYTELLDFEKEDYFKDDGDAVIVSYNLDYVEIIYK